MYATLFMLVVLLYPAMHHFLDGSFVLKQNWISNRIAMKVNETTILQCHDFQGGIKRQGINPDIFRQFKRGTSHI